ncbi:MAG: DUF2798 domain-containing protein [Dermatophilaceae bacterium]
MSRRLPARSAPLVFAALLSALMTVVVSGISTVRGLGLDGFTMSAWAQAFASSWPVAFPTVLVVAPVVRRLVGRIVAPSSAPSTSGAS